MAAATRLNDKIDDDGGGGLEDWQIMVIVACTGIAGAISCAFVIALVRARYGKRRRRAVRSQSTAPCGASDFGVEMPRSSDESRPGDGHSSGALDDSLGWRGARAWGSQDENDDGDSNHPAIEALRV